MVKYVKSNEKKAPNFNDRSVFCPHCGERNGFMSMVPSSCGRCFKSLPSIASLGLETERAAYHFSGDTLGRISWMPAKEG
jgi:hypothetical protein